MHLKVTPKGSLRAFIFAVISCIPLLLAMGAYARIAPAKAVFSRQSYNSWQQAYLQDHPFAPFALKETAIRFFDGAPGPLWSFAATQSNFVTGICLGCGVTNPARAVDSDTTTYSALVTLVGVGGTVTQRLTFAGDYQAGDKIALDLEVPGQLLAGGLLSGITVQTLNNGILNNDATALNGSLVQVNLLGSAASKFRAIIPVSKTFNAIQVTTGSVLAALGSLRIYEAAAIVPVTVNPDSTVIVSGQSTSFTAASRLSGAQFKWYSSPTGGTALHTGATFNTPPLTAATTYYAEATTPDNLSSYIRTPVVVRVSGAPGPIWTYGDEQDGPFVGGAACVLCSVTNPAQAADGDTTTASAFTMPLGLATTLGQRVIFPGVYYPGDSLVLILETPANLLSGQLLPNLIVQTYHDAILGAPVANDDATVLDAQLARIDLLGLSGGNRKFRVTLPIQDTCDAVQVNLRSTASLSLAQNLKLYEAVAMVPVTVTPSPDTVAYHQTATLTPSSRIAGATYNWYASPTGGAPLATGTFTTPPLTRNATYYVEAVDPLGKTSFKRTAVPVIVAGGAGPLWTYGVDQQSPITGGIACVLCAVNNPNLAVDEDTTTASRLVLPVGVATYVGQQIRFPAEYQAGDSVVFFLGTQNNPLATANLLNGIRVQTFNGATPNGDATFLNSNLIKLDLLGIDGGINKFRVAFAATQPFDGTRIDLTSTIGLLDGLNVYEAAAMMPVQVTRVNPASDTVEVGKTASFTAGIPRIPNATFSWYETPTGGTPVFTGANFTTPDILDNKVYYVEAFSPNDGLHSLIRTAVPIYAKAVNNLLCGAAATQSAGTSGVACLGCSVINPLLAIDGDVNSASELRVTIGLLGGVYQGLGFSALSGAKDTLRIGVGVSTGVIDLGALSGLTFTLYSGNTQVAQVNNAALLDLRLLGDTTRAEIVFAPGVAFDSVKIDFNALLAAISSFRIYYAKFTPPNAVVADSVVRACPGGSVALKATLPAGSVFRWYDSYSGGNLLFTGATFNASNITSDTTFYVEAVSTGADACGSNTRTPVQVKLGLPAVAVNPSTITIDKGHTATFNVVSPNANYTYRWFTANTGGIAIHTGAQFITAALDSNTVYYVQADSSGCSSKRTPVYVIISTLPPVPDIIPDTAYVSTGQKATFRIANPDPALTYRWYSVDSGGVVLATDTIYTTPAITANGKVYAEAVNASNQASRTRAVGVIQLVNAPGGLPCTYSNAQQSPVYTAPLSICLLCSVTNPGNAIDGDTTTASHIRSNVGIGYIGQHLQFQHPGMAGDSIRLILGLPTGLADAQLLGGVQVQTYNAGSPVGNPVFLNDFLLNLKLINANKFTATIPAQTAFDAVRISLGGVLSALTTLDVYNAEQVMLPAKPAPDSDSLTVCLGSSARIVAMDTTGITVGWYAAPTGGSPLFTGGIFNTPALNQASTTYYIGSSRNGCANTQRIPVTVKAVAQPAAPQLTAAAINICVGQVAGLSVLNPQAGTTYTWYDAATGGNQVATGATLNIVPATTGVDTLHYYVQASVATCTSSSRTGGTVYVSTRCNGGNTGDTATLTVCKGASITLKVDSIAAGATYQWYNAANNTLAFTGTSFVTPALNANIVYRLEAAFAGGIRDTVRVYDITVQDNLATPTLLAAEAITTPGGTATFTVANSLGGVMYKWYSTPTGGTPLDTGTSFTTPPLTGDSAKYYVEASAGACVSATRGVATVRTGNGTGVPCSIANSTQSPVYTAPISICLLCGVTDAAKAVDSDSTTASQVRANIGIGYIGQVLNFQQPGLAGDSIRLILGLPTGLADAQLLGGIRVQMYNNGSAAGSVLFLNGGLGVIKLQALTGNKFAATFAAPVNYNAVYVSIGGVLTALTTLEIYNAQQQLLPAKPTVASSSLTVCLGSSARLEATDTAGVIVKWYATATGGLPVFTGAVFNTPALNQPSTTYYIETSRNGCPNKVRVPVTVKTVPQPAAPQLAAAGVNVCVGQTATFSVQNPQAGISYKWYDAPAGGNLVDTGAVLNVVPAATGVDTARYYVEAGAGSCTSSSRTAGTAYVFTKCNGGNTGDTATLTICNGGTVTLRVDSVQAGATYQWYNAANNSLVATGTSFTTPALNADAIYRLEATFTGGAKDTIRVYEITVQSSLATPALVTGNITTTPGGTATFTVAGSLGGVTYTWYATATGGTPLATGTSFTTPALIGDSAKYYVEASAGTCVSGARGVATVRASHGGNGPCYVANTAQSPVYTAPVSICLLCGVANPDNAVDADSLTAARVTAGIGIGYVGQVLHFRQPGLAGDSIRLTLALPGGLADVQVLGGVRAQMYKNGSPVGNPIFLNGGLGVVKLQLLNSTKFNATFAAPVDYDAVYISIGGVLTAITSMDVFIAEQRLVPAKPSAASSSLQVCRGSSAQLTATDTAGVTIRWFATATGGTPLATGPVFNTPALNQASTTFYIETSRNSCPNPLRTSVTVLAINCGNGSADTTAITICRGSSTTLTVDSVQAGATYQWFNAATGAQVGTGTSFTTPALNANTTYRLEAVFSGGFRDTTGIFPITVTDPPVVPVLVNSMVVSCGSGPVQLAILNPQAGVTYNWYNALTGGTLLGTGTTISVTPPSGVDSVKYYAGAVIGTCASTSRATATVRVVNNLQPPVLVTSTQSTNLGGTATFTIANPQGGVTYKWYATATGGTPLAIGPSFTTPPLTADSVKYYVEASVGACVSSTRAVVTVKNSNNGGGDTGDTTNITICAATSLTLNAVNPQAGVTYRWYNTANNSLVFTGTSFTTPVLNAGITYLVESTLPGGTKDTNQVYIITISNNTTPPVVAASTVKVCSGQDAVLVVQNPLPGFTYQWFDAPTGGTQVFTGAVFTVAAVTGNRDYYVQSVLNNKCISATRTRVSIQAGSAPVAPTVASNNVITCIGGTATFNILNPDPAVTYRWYNQPANGTLLAIGTAYTTAALNSTTTYYVEAAYNAGCVSTARTGVTATVVSSIDAPLADGVISCAGQTAVLSVRSPQAGIFYRWYNTGTGGTALFTGASFTTPALTGNTTYYVESASGGGCVSVSRTPVSVTVNSAPAAPAVASAAITVCPGQTATLQVQNPAANVTYRWYTTPTGGTAVTTGPSYITGPLSANQQYYVEAVNAGGCASAQRTAVSVTTGAPDANDIIVNIPDPQCPGSAVTLTASAPSVPGADFRWYSTATGGTQLATGASFTTPPLDNTTTYYVEVFAGTGCVSAARKEVTVTVLQQLATPVVTVSDSAATSVTFSWSPVAGAIRYEVSTDGSTFITPSSGANGTTHTITGLSPNQTATLQVRAVAENGCQTSQLSAAVTGRASNPAGDQVFVPNLFSPNGDGVNDVLMVYGNTIATLELHIFNYWGQEVFQSKDLRQGWDGRMNGKPQPSGVYVYTLTVKLQNGATVKRKGNITLIR